MLSLFRRSALVVATAFVFGITGKAQAASLASSTNPTSTLNAGVSGSSYTNTVSDDLASQLQASLDMSIKEVGTPGAVVGIVSPQGTWFGASGVSNLETGTAMQLDNLFPAGSIGKPFTAAAALKLQEEGKLRLDDTLGKWLPDIASQIPDGSSITIRQLLNGSAGIYDVSDDWEADVLKDPSILLRQQPQDLVAYAYGKPRFTGRTCSPIWCYTNTSSLIAGLVLEKATGSTYSSVVRNEVLEPLGLNHTFVGGEEKNLPELAQGYQDINGDGRLDNATTYSVLATNIIAGGGGIISDAEDLIRFSQGLFGGKLLKHESLQEMLTFVDTGDDNFKFGLGVEDFEKVNPFGPFGQYLGKGGDITGYEGQLSYFPEQGIFSVALVNGVQSDLPSYALTSASLKTFFSQGQGGNPKSVPEPSAIAGLMVFVGAGFLLKRNQRCASKLACRLG